MARESANKIVHGCETVSTPDHRRKLRSKSVRAPELNRKQMILVIDNYDSFTYNLVQYLGELDQTLEIRRNDEITLTEIEKMAPDRIVISPGPGTPKQAGISIDLIRRFGGKIPVLGVCLGHQAIAEAFGGEVVRAERLMHGKVSPIFHDGKTIFKGLPSPFDATRYHSLIVKKETLPSILEISAYTSENEIMGLRHRKYLIEGVQFHPESILTSEGKELLRNFIHLKEAETR